MKGFSGLKDLKYFPAKSRDPSKCFLFICEGDSAKNFICSMLNGNNEYYGMLILQGKPMNFRKQSYEKISKNKVFALIKHAIGLNLEVAT